MNIPISEIIELNASGVREKLSELSINSLDQLLPRIGLSRDRVRFEQYLQVSLSNLLERFPELVLAGTPIHRKTPGALIPAGGGTPGGGPGAAAGGAPLAGSGLFSPTPALPSKVDLSPRFTMPVRQQGAHRATCVAFATCAACEALEGAAGYFAPQLLYWQCKGLDTAPWNARCGTFVRTAMAAFSTHGLSKEVDWPYRSSGTPCPDDHSPPPQGMTTQMSIVKYRILSNGDLAALKAALAAGHPVVASVRVFPWWFKRDYARGEITTPLPGDWSDEAHAVVFTGYEDHPNSSGDGTLFFRNSWGPAFGAVSSGGFQDGYGELRYRYVVGYPGEKPYTVELAELW